MRLPLKRRPRKPKSPTGEMSLVEHLGELRTRLIRAVVAVVLGAIVVWAFFNPIFDFLSEPYCELRGADDRALAADDRVLAADGSVLAADDRVLGADGSVLAADDRVLGADGSVLAADDRAFAADGSALTAEGSGDEDTTAEGEGDCQFLVTDPLESFNVRLTLSGYGGLILALPVILYQLGRFVLPGLYPNEKRALAPFLASSIALLFGGMTVAYFFLPRALQVLVEIGSDRFEAFFSPNQYLSFFVKMVLAFGIAFELPLVLVFLQMIGVLQTDTLKRNRRIAIVAVVILAAVITPTGDPFTLLFLAVPMYLFYEIAIIIGGRLTKKQQAVA